MNSLANMSLLDKGHLLVALFPEKKDEVLYAIIDTCIDLITEQKVMLELGNGKEIEVDDWLKAAEKMRDLLKQDYAQLVESNQLFAEKLFTDELANTTIHCLLIMALRWKPDDKLRLMINVLFC